MRLRDTHSQTDTYSLDFIFTVCFEIHKVLKVHKHKVLNVIRKKVERLQVHNEQLSLMS